MRVLVDSSVWIDHLRRGEPDLVRLLEAGRVVTHPAVIGELACGSLRKRESFLRHITLLPVLAEGRADEALHLLEEHRLWGRGLGWVDILLLTSCRISNTRIWTRDRGLRVAAAALAVSHSRTVEE